MILKEKISLGIFLGSLVVVYAGAIAIVARQIHGRYRGQRRPITKVGWVFLAFSILGIFCLMYATFIEPYWIEIKYVQIRSPKLKNTTLRIVLISDLHCDKKIRNESKLPALINGLRPDVIAFAGDTINVPEALPIFKKTLSSLRASLGKYAVWGNRDAWYWKRMDLFGQTGFTVLNKDTIQMQKDGETVYLAGLSYRYPERIQKVLDAVPDDGYRVFLFHSPRFVREALRSKIDLYLTGHTHGGQFALPGYGALVTLSKFGKKFEAGQYRIEDMTVYVNRGIGMEGGFTPRIRFLSRPEITVFDILPL